MATQRRPAAAKAPSALAAQRAEAAAEDEPTVVEFDGDEYTVPAPMDWDLDVFDAIELGQIVRAVRVVLGPEQFAKFRENHSKVRDVDAFFSKLAEAQGLDSGK